MSVAEPILHVSIEFSPPLNLPLVHCPGVGKYGIRRWRTIRQGPKNRRVLRYHQGVDLRSQNPTDALEVYSTNWGRIEFIENSDTRNQTVAIKYLPFGAGYIMQYRHLENVCVSVGQNVSAGKLIGFISPDPYPGNPHLHFEWRRLADPSHDFAVDGSIPLDPTPLLYRFEAEGWPSDWDKMTPVARHSNRSYKKIDRIRIVP